MSNRTISEAAKPAIAKFGLYLDTLEQQIMTLSSDPQWLVEISLHNLFHDYTLHNIMLAWSQCPELTHMAGAGTWKKEFGRHPSKGSRAIYILAPNKFTVTDKDEHGQETKHTILRGFHSVPVFDISQTTPYKKRTDLQIKRDAALLNPTERARDLDYDAPAFYETVKTAIASYDLELGEEHMPEDIDGYYLPATDKRKPRIAINNRQSTGRKAGVLIHEAAHHLCTLADDPDHANYRATRAAAEVLAESTAFLVMSHFGLPANSYIYIANWQYRGDLEPGFLRTVIDRLKPKFLELVAVIEQHLPAEQRSAQAA